MSEENNVQTQTPEEPQANNPSTQADTKNVPYDRFVEVNTAKNDLAGQVGKLQAKIDKLNSDNKSKAEAKLVQDGKLKEALDLMTKERDSFKGQADQWSQYQNDKRELLLSKLTTDEDKSIAEGLSDLNKLEAYVNKVANPNAPSTNSSRAANGGNMNLDINKMSEDDLRANWGAVVDGFKKNKPLSK